MKPILSIIILLILSGTVSAMGAGKIKVEALFSDKALVVINGQRHLMQRGDVIDGIKLLAASGRGATVRLPDGSQQTLQLNQTISRVFSKAQNPTLRIYANANGMFELDGSINGRPTGFLLDTGATYIALSSDEADRLGIAYQSAPKSLIQTASEVVPAWQVRLGQVKVGDIVVSNVDAVILNGSTPSTALLGMSFLKNLKMQRNGAAMILEQKY